MGKPKPMCVVCGKGATFTSPADFCTRHWNQWWSSGNTPRLSEAWMKRLLTALKEARRG
jgi:hypothetical protein